MGGDTTEDVKEVESPKESKSNEDKDELKNDDEQSKTIAPLPPNPTSTEMRSPEELKKCTKSITVRRIIDLIGEMENSSQLDVSSLSKFHPCPQCSGKLITI